MADKRKITGPPKPIPDTPENIARALLRANPKRDSKKKGKRKSK